MRAGNAWLYPNRTPDHRRHHFTLAAIAIPNFLSALDQVRIARAVGDVHAIGNDIQGYAIVNGKFPDTLADVNHDQNLDPWGNPYQYLNFADTKGKGKEGPLPRAH